jgi:hypothetical protein
MNLNIRSGAGLIFGLSMLGAGFRIAYSRVVSGAYGALDFGPFHSEIGIGVIIIGIYFIAISVRLKM